MTNTAATGASPVLQRQELSEVPSQSIYTGTTTRAASRCLACRANERSGLQEAGRMGEGGVKGGGGGGWGGAMPEVHSRSGHDFFCRGPKLPVHGKM